MYPLDLRNEVLVVLDDTVEDETGILENPTVLETLGALASDMVLCEETVDQVPGANYVCTLETEFEVMSRNGHTGYLFTVSCERENERFAGMKFLLVDVLVEEEINSILERNEASALEDASIVWQ